MRIRYLIIALILFQINHTFGQSDQSHEVTIIDSKHYSHVLAEVRNFRVFLPGDYEESAEKKYPVIYFMHGWSQRSFGSGGNTYSEYDQLDQNNGDNIEKFVSQHQVIVVKSDGYNRAKEEDYYVRPYNVGPVETHRQFPIYFPELIDHIDLNYQTIPDRGHRAISGLSMGGFMSFFIGGKYPHLFSAVGSFCGSPEFVIGPKEMPVEYRHLDMYRNYDGLNVRLHYGDQDFIRGYHEDLNRTWTNVMDQYSYKIFPGDEHTTSGLNEMFQYLFDTFKDLPGKPDKWSHIDIYPQFTVWDYLISSDRTQSGFTSLKNVDKRGFQSVVRDFLPDGSIQTHVNLSVLTPAIYEKNQPYVINDYHANRGIVTQTTIVSDELGRLKIVLDGAEHHIGINKREDDPNIALVSFTADNNTWALTNKEVSLSLELLNKGMASTDQIKARLYSANKHVTISKGESSFKGMKANERQHSETPFIFQINAENTDMIQFELELDNGQDIWKERFEVRVKNDPPLLKDYVIADGGSYIVTKGGDDLDTVSIGHGNNDGVANPGEFIEILARDNNRYYRTQIWADAPCINPAGINLRNSDYWGKYDNVGASAKSSTLLVASNCQPGTHVDLLLEYWMPDKPFHIIKEGKLSIEIQGADQTPPQFAWLQIPGDNKLQVKIHDGAAIQKVTATFIDKDENTFVLDLNDLGKDGDIVESDQVFGVDIPPKPFGFYRVILEGVDEYSNRSRKEMPGTFILH